MAYALEDEFGDILQKARDGQGWSQDDLSRASGLPVGEIARMERYEFIPPDAVIQSLAQVLDLNASCLLEIAHERWTPASPETDPYFQLEIMEVFMGSYPVKCYLVSCPQTKEAVVIDTGANPETIIKKAKDSELKIQSILLTHNHPDHAWGLDILDGEFECPAWIGSQEITPRGSRDLRLLNDGDTISFGRLGIRVISTPGHTAGGVSYHIGSTVFSGDCLFAGSMGRANSSWKDLFESITRRLLVFPEDTRLHPGHGPATTVGEEKKNNPFFYGKV